MIKVYDEEGREVRGLPTKREVCPRCDGGGTQDVWDGGMTGDEMAEQGPEFFEDYRAGVYSKPCEECNGRNVVDVFDRANATAAQIALYEKAEREEWEYYEACAAEARYFGYS